MKKTPRWVFCFVFVADDHFFLSSQGNCDCGEHREPDAPGLHGDEVPGGEELCAQGLGGSERPAGQPKFCQNQ